MQLYALTETGEILSASRAEKSHNYLCLECHGVVHIRGGVHRQRHFYHLQLTPSCRQSQKSLEHLQTQCHLQKIISSPLCQLECPFPQIGRIADVAWHEKKMVFEVQCSPIPALEVAQRTQDYRSLGWEVVWILHERQFGQKRLSAAELQLRQHPCYFCNINADGEGIIYDRFDTIERGHRSNRLEPLITNLAQPKTAAGCGVLKRVHERLTENSLYFTGDLIDLALSDRESPYIAQAQQIEKSLQTMGNRKSWLQSLKGAYRVLFQLVLERVSR